jgi:hypothetical protein
MPATGQKCRICLKIGPIAPSVSKGQSGICGLVSVHKRPQLSARVTKLRPKEMERYWGKGNSTGFQGWSTFVLGSLNVTFI